MLSFILNNQQIKTEESSGNTLLDFLRYHKHLCGTKIGCREGDCGACTILVGELIKGKMRYRSMTSCIMPLGNAQGKHIVSIEGLNMDKLTPVQKAIVDEGGTQCGFCTVGFVVSLTGFCLSEYPTSSEEALASIDGNICRCTGYKSLERATERIRKSLEKRDSKNRINWLVEEKFIPAYFKDIPKQLRAIQKEIVLPPITQNGTYTPVAGGTDLYVQRPEEMPTKNISHFFDDAGLKGISQKGKTISIGAASTAEDLRRSPIMQKIFPNLWEHMKLVSSTPIRNMGTLAGNLVNASPIGDLTIYFLALDASITLRNGKRKRTIKLKKFYKDYKVIDKKSGEYLETISFEAPPINAYFNFEKVCKRTYLDIATVNTAIQIQLQGDTIKSAHVSAGGVGPTPKYLAKTSKFLAGKTLNEFTISNANEIIQKEISPISDVRGSEEYKRLLLRQLFFAHFQSFFPETINLKLIL